MAGTCCCYRLSAAAFPAAVTIALRMPLSRLPAGIAGRSPARGNNGGAEAPRRSGSQLPVRGLRATPHPDPATCKPPECPLPTPRAVNPAPPALSPSPACLPDYGNPARPRYRGHAPASRKPGTSPVSRTCTRITETRHVPGIAETGMSRCAEARHVPAARRPGARPRTADMFPHRGTRNDLASRKPSRPLRFAETGNAPAARKSGMSSRCAEARNVPAARKRP
jgi:hypothetical protein